MQKRVIVLLVIFSIALWLLSCGSGGHNTGDKGGSGSQSSDAADGSGVQNTDATGGSGGQSTDATGGSGGQNTGVATKARTYTTNFLLTENPVTEGGNWINGKATGLDWSNVATTPGHAYGLEDGVNNYTDGTALLSGTWGADQAVQATVFVGTVYATDEPEVELRLRSSLMAHYCSGYEVDWGVTTSRPYLTIVRWNGVVKDFTYLISTIRSGVTAHTGDVLSATIIGSTITVYINGVQKAQVTDTTYKTGNPGMGFNYYCEGACSGARDAYGFSSYTATDGMHSP